MPSAYTKQVVLMSRRCQQRNTQLSVTFLFFLIIFYSCAYSGVRMACVQVPTEVSRRHQIP